MRTIEINITEDTLPPVDQKEVQDAIGRLSMWALDQFDTVKIYNDGKFDLVANYSRSDNAACKYVIGAEYTFHS